MTVSIQEDGMPSLYDQTHLEPVPITRWQNDDLRPVRCLSCNKSPGLQSTS